MAGVINSTRFLTNSSKEFAEFIDYMDRNEATRKKNYKKFSAFNDYMGNPEKLGALFTKDNEYLNATEKKKLKSAFNVAQINGSNMWQSVFSFENDWLENQGIYDSKTGYLDEAKLQNATRDAMAELEKREGLKDITWTASLHYNTDNIHVHIAFVEVNPKRERGKVKPKSLYTTKSSFVNSLLNKQEELSKINSIIRDNLIDGKKNMSFKEDIEMRKMVKDIIKILPKDKRQWQYNYNTMQNVRPLIDNLSKYYIDNYKKEEFKELVNRLEKEDEFYKDTYGEKKVKTATYKDNKIQDLYTRMGNSILKEIKDHVKEEELKKQKMYQNRKDNFESKRNLIIAQRNIKMIKDSLKEDFENIKNMNEYEKLQYEIENSRQMSM
ncbi:MobP2 family relaxase [Clostridium perfringens]|nr:MobP2 family relaxase [Clostridium perfringens]